MEKILDITIPSDVPADERSYVKEKFEEADKVRDQINLGMK